MLAVATGAADNCPCTHKKSRWVEKLLNKDGIYKMAPRHSDERPIAARALMSSRCASHRGQTADWHQLRAPARPYPFKYRSLQLDRARDLCSAGGKMEIR